MIFTNYCWLQVDEDRPRYVFPCASLAEEGVEAVIASADSFVGWHLAIGLDTMLQTIQFPAGITDLYSGLSNMN